MASKINNETIGRTSIFFIPFLKIIKTFHPDKNSDLEEDIYYHIILAHQILIDKELRIKYDNFIENKELK